MGPVLIVPPSPEGDISIKTEQLCPCNEMIVFTEEIVQLQIVQPYITPDGYLVSTPPMYETEEGQGDFLYTPYHIQFSPCWERIEEWLEEQIEGEPPIEDAESILACHYCKSGVRSMEYCGYVAMGEIHISPRSPNGMRAEEFVRAGPPIYVCIYCLLLINEGNMEFWDPEEGGISQDGECADCTRARCWRSPPEACDCPCHFEEEDAP